MNLKIEIPKEQKENYYLAPAHEDEKFDFVIVYEGSRANIFVLYMDHSKGELPPFPLAIVTIWLGNTGNYLRISNMSDSFELIDHPKINLDKIEEELMLDIGPDSLLKLIVEK